MLVLVSWLLDDGSYQDYFPLGKWRRDAKIYWLFEGTCEIQRLVISRANGGMA